MGTPTLLSTIIAASDHLGAKALWLVATLLNPFSSHFGLHCHR